MPEGAPTGIQEGEIASANRREGHSPGPVFIVGMPRSGTKLLRGLLNQHARIRIPDAETNFFPFLVRWTHEHGEPRDDASLQRLADELKSAPYFAFRAPGRGPFCARDWREFCDGRYDAAGLFEGFVRYETDSPRVEDPAADIIWGDKSPPYIRHIPLLLESFPDGRVVHIVRDVRDYCVSIRKAWNKDVRRAAFQWGRDVETAHRQCRANPLRCIEMSFEDLLQAPEAQLRRVCGFLGVEFTDAMTRLNRPAENRGDATGSSEIVRNNFAKFSDRLTRREIADIEALAFETMRLLHYQPLYADRQQTMSRAELAARRIRDGVQLALRGRRERGLTDALRFHVSHARLID